MNHFLEQLLKIQVNFLDQSRPGVALASTPVESTRNNQYGVRMAKAP
jgi:hypothetical protein